MAFAYVTEFSDMQPMTVAGGLGAVVLWPEVAAYQIANGGGATQGPNFNSKTKMIRVNTDAACSIEIGLNPTAVATKNRMSPNSTEYFGVQQGLNHQISVIANV